MLPARRLVLPLAAALVLGASAAWWFTGGGASAGDMDAGDAAKVALGERVYTEHCAACHGADLKGQPDWQQRRADGRLPAPPQDETGHSWHHPPEQLFALVKQGPAALAGGGYQSDMPGFAGRLSDDEIWAALSYIKSRWPADIQARYDSMQHH